MTPRDVGGGIEPCSLLRGEQGPSSDASHRLGRFMANVTFLSCQTSREITGGNGWYEARVKASVGSGAYERYKKRRIL